MHSEKPSIKKGERILALEVRPRMTGFAMFETRAHLLDWGMRKHRTRRDELPRLAARKIAPLMDFHEPSIVVVRTRAVPLVSAREKSAAIVRVARREAKKRSIEFHTISAKAIREFFVAYQCTSKYQRAILIARWLPELSWRLPPTYKVWKSEDQRLVIFDAAAAALAFMNKSPPTMR
jgi:hypothetical protein